MIVISETIGSMYQRYLWGGDMAHSNFICIMSTLLTGGTHRHYMEMAKEYSFRRHILLVEYDENFMIAKWIFQGKLLQEKILFGNCIDILAYELQRCNVKLIHLHHFIYMNDPLRNLLLSGRYRLAVTLHDYYVVCPRINMTKNGIYCNEAGDAECNTCMHDTLAEMPMDITDLVAMLSDIVSWRKWWFDFLDKADYIFVPSSDQRERLLRYFPSLTKIRVVENPEIVVPLATCNGKIRKIGILGTISEAKGRSVLLECARLAEKQHFNMQFVLFGTLSPNECNLPSNLIVRGKYKENEVYNLIDGEGIDFFWFTAICPETYSYVLTIPIRLGTPVIAADLGAIAERIKCGGWGEVYSVQSDTLEILHALNSFEYEYYRKTGNFEIKNDHFLSFQDMYCDDQELFNADFGQKTGDRQSGESTNARNCTGFADKDVMICGNLSSVQSHEFRFLWNKQVGLFLKLRLFWATEKIPLLQKVAKKFYKKSRSLQNRMGRYGMEKAKLFSKENFYINFVDVIRNIVHFGGADRNFAYWQWKTVIVPDIFEVAA